MKYRKKPVEVEAEQWWPPSDERHDPSMLADPVNRPNSEKNPSKLWPIGSLYLTGTWQEDAFFTIRTMEGHLWAKPGDWIVTDSEGDKTLFRPEAFEAAHEPVEETADESQ